MSSHNNAPFQQLEPNEDTGFLASFLAHDKDMIRQGEKAREDIGLFTVKSANVWLDEAKNQPIPKKLFAEFWFEGELCILFADTNLGKSILAVQIGDSISRGKAIPGFTLEAAKQPILYYDFELSKKQFEARYSKDFSELYLFDAYFLRAEINPDAEVPDGDFEDYLDESLEKSIIETGAKVLIIDNLTYLANETERAKTALPLMKRLKALKSKYGLSILALAHTPKRDLSKPITRNDLQGSKMLMSFCDSSFTIGESYSDKNARYLKQIKQRNCEQIFDADNVCLCQINKAHNFLQFEFLAYSKEQEHLKEQTDEDTESLKERVVELKGQGKSFREIGELLGMSHMKAKRLFDNCNTL